MRKWAPPAWGGTAGDGIAAIGAMVGHLGAPDFSARLLGTLHPLLPAASWSAYRVGGMGGVDGGGPRLFMSASLGIPDTTRDCWQAYLSGPVRDDRSLRFDDEPPVPAQLCHITAREVAQEHRARVYDAHGMAERLSVVAQGDPDDRGGLFAVNFYRHAHQRPLSDGQIAAFEQLAPALLALARKQVALVEWRAAEGAETDHAQAAAPEAALPLPLLRQRLQQVNPGFTARELDVCARLLRGMTHDGIAADLAVSVATVKTYRNRAFNRLGIHFRSELFARVLGRGG